MSRKLLMAAALATGLTALAGSAHAGPIAAGSTLSLDGTASYTSTSISFVNPANIGAASGSFATDFTTLPCNGCATMTSFTSTTATPFTLYTATEGANTSTLSVSSDIFSNSSGSLLVTGSGTLSLTGFTPAAGTFILTTQGPSGTKVTFSVTSTAVPEPASLSLFGTALLGLGLFFGLRRKQV